MNEKEFWILKLWITWRACLQYFVTWTTVLSFTTVSVLSTVILWRNSPIPYSMLNKCSMTQLLSMVTHKNKTKLRSTALGLVSFWLKREHIWVQHFWLLLLEKTGILWKCFNFKIWISKETFKAVMFLWPAWWGAVTVSQGQRCNVYREQWRAPEYRTCKIFCLRGSS